MTNEPNDLVEVEENRFNEFYTRMMQEVKRIVGDFENPSTTLEGMQLEMQGVMADLYHLRRQVYILTHALGERITHLEEYGEDLWEEKARLAHRLGDIDLEYRTLLKDRDLLRQQNKRLTDAKHLAERRERLAKRRAEQFRRDPY